jgi:acyl-CoA thioesterase FadM
MDISRLLTNQANKHKKYSGDEVHLERRWSYGDVENNGVYYHPQLTHYAHQGFEEFFLKRVGFHYVDLSRTSNESHAVRLSHKPPLPRMTFPVEWLHQWMGLPMQAGERFRVTIDTVEIDAKRIAVRAWVYNEADLLAASVLWLRWAVELDPKRKTIPIPAWFPRG